MEREQRGELKDNNVSPPSGVIDESLEVWCPRYKGGEVVCRVCREYSELYHL